MSRNMLMSVIVSWAALTAGCNGSGKTPTEPAAPPAPPVPPVPPPASTAVIGTVSSNHPAPHEATISGEQLTAGSAVVLNIQGSAFHSHTISLTSQQVLQVGQKTRVSVTSSTDPHSSGAGHHNHDVTFN
jgi:hypothetical protein